MTSENDSLTAPNVLLHGTVVKSTGSWYIVRGAETEQLYRCRLRGKFKIKVPKDVSTFHHYHNIIK